MCGVHGLIVAMTYLWTTVSAIEWSLSRPTCSFVIQAQQAWDSELKSMYIALGFKRVPGMRKTGTNCHVTVVVVFALNNKLAHNYLRQPKQTCIGQTLLQLPAVCAPVTCVLACSDWRTRQRPSIQNMGSGRLLSYQSAVQSSGDHVYQPVSMSVFIVILTQCQFFFERCLSLCLSKRLCDVFCFSLFHLFKRCGDSFLRY